MNEQATGIRIVNGDCLEVLRDMPDNSVDSIVTDPPYGLSNTKPQQVADVLKAWVAGDTETVPTKRGGFMGKDWDSFVPPPAVWEECMRVLRPGGHMAVFAGARTQDLMGLSIRLAGFEIRDTLGWIYGSGFPKSMDISKAIDKAAGAEREVVGKYLRPDNGKPHGDFRSDNDRSAYQSFDMCDDTRSVTAPATSEAQRWDGWGTALKPAIEPIILARKPLVGTVVGNVLAHGVGGLNIDASRVPTNDKLGGGHATHGQQMQDGWRRPWMDDPEAVAANAARSRESVAKSEELGRFPANVLLDEHAAAEMDEQSGVLRARGNVSPTAGGGGMYGHKVTTVDHGKGDTGGASRFFPVFKYQAKAPKKERPVIEREDGTKIQHPTVKPLALLDWLVTLITPPGGTVLDPFAGTGTTLQAALNKGFSAIGVEQDPDYIQLIEIRLAADGTDEKEKSHE